MKSNNLSVQLAASKSPFAGKCTVHQAILYLLNGAEPGPMGEQQYVDHASWYLAEYPNKQNYKKDTTEGTQQFDEKRYSDDVQQYERIKESEQLIFEAFRSGKVQAYYVDFYNYCVSSLHDSEYIQSKIDFTSGKIYQENRFEYYEYDNKICFDFLQLKKVVDKYYGSSLIDKIPDSDNIFENTPASKSIIDLDRYGTEFLEAIKSAIDEFNLQNNRATPKHKILVGHFITAGFTGRAATAMATIMRPKSAQAGNRSKKPDK